MCVQASAGKRRVQRRGSVVSSPVSYKSATSALFAHFCESRPGANNTRLLLQRLCRDAARVVLSDYNLATQSMEEVAVGIRSGLGRSLSSGAVADKAVDWIVGVGKDGSTIGRPGNGAHARRVWRCGVVG